MRPIRAACLGTASALVTLLACAPVAASATTDTGAAHDKSKHQVITLVGRLAQQNRFPIDPTHPSQGDRTVFRSELYDENDINKVGETNGTCTTTLADGGGAEVCVVTYTLPGRGQLSVQGMVFGHLNPGPPPSFDNGITGGTGEFDRARGSVHADTIGVGKRRFTIDLYL
ncbi:hypothetical protein AB0B78_36875 [Streptomyces sp. NPDC040724]|uniref:allene oxide cyclase barrel-like domain-containing protein n=1 Tax=unclassified Streptomyces TaxID=2593676 RepID=UPI0033E575D3